MAGGTCRHVYPDHQRRRQLVAFESNATNLHPLKTSSQFSDVFVRDVGGVFLSLASRNLAGNGSGNQHSTLPGG